MIKFEYNGKIYAPSDVDKKLKKLGITLNDVKIINDDNNAENMVTTKKTISIFNTIMNTDNIPYHIFWNSEIKGWLFKNISESTSNFANCKYIGTSNPPELMSDDIINEAWMNIIKKDD